MNGKKPLSGAWTPEKVERIQKIMLLCNPASLDSPVSGSIDFDPTDITTLGDLVPDTAPSPEEIAIKEENKFHLLQIINKCLSAREVKVITLRYGFDNGYGKTLEEVGREFHVTRERIRQIEAKALLKIRRYMQRNGVFKRDEWDVD